MSFEDLMIDDGYTDPDDYMDYLEGKADEYFDSLGPSIEDEDKIETEKLYYDVLVTPVLRSKGISDIHFVPEINSDIPEKKKVLIHVTGTFLNSETPYFGVIHPGYYAEEGDNEILSYSIEDVIIRVAENRVRFSRNGEWHVAAKKKGVWTYFLNNTNTFHLSGEQIDGYFDYPWIRNPLSEYSTVVTEEDQKNSFKDGKRVVYSIDKKLLLDGEGPFPPRPSYPFKLFDPDAPILRSLSSYIIEEETEYICDDAFRRFEKLVEITIPDSVLRIGEGAFADCIKLLEIHIPKSVLSLGAGAFSNCYSLKQVVFETDEDGPSLLRVIPSRCFSHCGFREIHLPLSIERIESWAFAGCVSLTTLRIHNPDIKIDDKAFYGCSSLMKVIVPIGSKDSFLIIFGNIVVEGVE